MYLLHPGGASDTPVTAAQARHPSNVTLASRMNVIHGSHDVRLGFDYQHFPVSENFSFDITDSNFNPLGSKGFIATLSAFDLSRGGRPGLCGFVAPRQSRLRSASGTPANSR